MPFNKRRAFSIHLLKYQLRNYFPFSFQKRTQLPLCNQPPSMADIKVMRSLFLINGSSHRFSAIMVSAIIKINPLESENPAFFRSCRGVIGRSDLKLKQLVSSKQAGRSSPNPIRCTSMHKSFLPISSFCRSGDVKDLVLQEFLGMAHPVRSNL